MAGMFDDLEGGASGSAAAGGLFDDLEAKPATSGVTRRLVGDTAITALKSAIAVPEIAVGIGDLVTGGRAGKAAEQAGFRPKEAKAFLDDYLSPEQKAANEKLAQADGFVDTLSTAVDNPSTILHTGLESIAPMLAGGVVARGLMAAPAVAGKLAPWAAGAIGEGVVGAGMGAESLRQQTEDGLLTGEQAGLAGLAGVGTGLIGAGGAKIAQKLGIGEIDTLLAGGNAGAATTKGVARKVAEGAAVEGVFQELPQSTQEQALQNIALGKPWDEGLGNAAAMGLLTGAALGGIAGPLGGKALVQPAPTAENPAPAPVPAPDPDAGAISRTAALLPAPSIAGLLPAPDSVMFADGDGNVSSQGPARDVDREYRLTGREQGPRDFGPGMDQIVPQGEQAPLEGQLIRGGIGAQSQSSAREPAIYDNEPSLGLPAPGRVIPDMRADNITVAPDGTAVPGKTATPTPTSYVQGGPGMDQQREVGKTYKGLPAANRAIRNAANPEQLEAVKVGPQTFEVRAKPTPAKRIVNRDRDSVMQAVIRLGGVKTEWRRDTTGDDKGNKFLPGVGALWSDKTGTGLDDMASLLDQSGYVPAGEMQRDGGVSWLQQALRDEVGGMKTHAAPGSKLQEAQALKAEADRLEAQASQQEQSNDFDTAETVASDLLDDIDLLEIRAAAAAKHAADLDEIFGDTPSESSPRTQAADQAADGIQGQPEDASRGAGGGQRPQGSQPDARAESPTEETPSLELASQTEAELAAIDAANKARIRAEEKAQAEADEKRRKDEERAQIKAQSETQADTFTLGVSGEDALSGQGGMFDSQPSLSELGGKPTAEKPVPKVTRQQAITEAQGAAAEVLSRGGTDADAIRAATDQLIERMADDPSISISSDAPAAVKAAKRREKSSPVEGSKNVADQLAAIDLNDLSSLIDEVSNEVAAPQTSKPKSKRSTKAKTAEGKPRIRPAKSPAERTDTTKPGDVTRTAGAIAKSMGVNMSKAGMNALEGLTQLFGGPGRLNSGLSFDEETYAKAKPYFAAAMADVQAAGKDLRDFIRALVGSFGDGVKPYILRYAQDLKQEQENVGADSGVEPDSAQDAEPGAGANVLGQEPGEARPADRQLGEQGGRSGAGNADGVPAGGSTADGKRGDQQVDGQQPAVEAGAAGSPDGGRGSSASTGGLYAERDTNQAADRAIEQAVTPSKANVKASNSPATLAEIKQQLPFLTEGQAEDVVFAEKRLMKPDGYGVLYTNGTGTGKTFTGLGVMARSAARGKDSILVVAPKQTIVDAWVKAAKGFFGLDIAALKDTSDNGGSGIVATTYANLAANNSLAQRDWDMVVADEAHYLSSAEDGANTGALTSLRALTMRRGFARELVRMQSPDMVEAIERLNVEAKAARVEENNALSDRLQAQASAIHGQLDELTKAKAGEIAAIAPADKPRAVFLSATPFAYEKNVAWAQEFLFDWGVAEDGDGQAYNSGGLFERFMIQHFGYRMRYNKLTAPDAKVDSGLMQRAFNSWLKREGALSARALDSNFDYDRLFVTVDSQIGRRVDDALKWLWNMSSGRDLAGNDVKMSDDERAAFGKVNERIAKDNFNYHARMYFLEAIKAREALPHIRAQLAAGRKVLVMHDFKKGGVVNPFRQTFAAAAEQKAYERFASDFSDLIRAFSSLPSPIDQLTRAFPDALVYNGSVSAKLRIAMQNDFNRDDDDSPRVIIAQGDAMREGVSIHDTSGKYPRVLVHLGMPVKPTASIQQEGRIYRTGQASNALFRYFTIGTSWERSAFASKIAARAGAAENLAMGEQARGLKQAFIDAYENADLYAPGFEGEGLGGKAADRAAAAALTPWDMAKSYYFGTKKQGAGRAARGREGNDYFATPEPVGLKMVEWADIRGGESVLEPSAGHGAIARWFPDNSTVRVIEDSAELASRVALHVDGDVVHGRFEDHNIVNKYDAIVMNPPYGLGGAVAIPHLAKAADHLRDGGRVVALIPTGPAADKKFDNWFYGQDKNGNSLHPDLHLVGDVKMPGVTFERAGTAVATRVVIIEKVGKDKAEQMQPARTADLSSITDIGELFTRMESMEMRARVKPVEEEAEQTAPAKSVQEKGPKQTYAQKAAVGKPKLVSDEPIFDYTAKSSGKVMRGAIVRGISLEEVKEKYYKYAFKMDGGVFLREEFIQSPDTDGPRFSRSATGATATTLGRGDVEQIAARLVTEATVARRFVFAAWEELPQAIKDRAAAQGAKPGEIKAVHWKGKTYLVDRRFTDAADVERTIFHEYYAHYGLRQQYGKDLHRKLLRTWAKVGGTKGVRAMAAAQGFNIDHYIEGAKQDKELTEAQRRVLVMDELLAHMAESTGSLKRLIQEWYGAVRDWLRSNGWAELAKLDAADLAFILRGARQAAKRADGGAVRGQPLFQRAEAAKKTATAAFKNWFGDSKVVDANGEPLVVYHGSPDLRFLGEDGEFKSEKGRYGFGRDQGAHWFAASERTAKSYADPRRAFDYQRAEEGVIPAYIKLENPLIIDGKGQKWRDAQKSGKTTDVIEEARNGGHDGVIIRNVRDNYQTGVVGGDQATDTYVVWESSQIKSATGNNGDFNPANPDIRFKRAEGIATAAFKRWFGASKVVNNQGEPKILYHGTGEDFTVFDQGRSGSSTRHSTAPLGIFMTGDRDTAQAYADKASDGIPGYARVMQLYAAIRNPYMMTVAESLAIESPGEAVTLRAKLEREGYDGINLEGTDTWVAFSNTQVKSATDNNGEFDEWSGDIRFRRSARDLFDRATGPAPLDRNDPFAAENRRLREDDKTLWAKAKKVFARQFAPGGLLPEAVFNEKITRDSEFQAVEFDVRHLSSALSKAVKADFGVDIESLTPAQMKTLAEALSGRVDPGIPESTKVAIVAMRQYIDSLSGEYLSILQNQVEANMEGADQALIDKITGNLGAYVNRSYQAFDDPKWFKTVPTEVVNTARAYLANGYMEQGETAAEARRLADVTVNEMLKNGTAYDSMGAFIAEGKLGAKDLTVLIKRKEIAPEIRALLGEYMDPRLNFAKSATKMGRLVWNQRFLDRVLSFGMGTILFEGKNRPADATTQIAGEKSETYAPLNGLWTYPEVAQAFQDALGKEQMSDLYRTVVRLNGMVKYGKTILSPTTAMRNWQSAMFFSLANGHFDLTQMKKSWAALREQVTQNATGDDLTYLRKLKRLGVVYDTPYAGEMMALLQDARMDELLSSKSGTGLKWLRKANQFAQGFYSFGDDFWKIIGFENEKAGLLKAGIPLAEAEAMAAKRIRDTYPTYSMIGKAIQWLRRFPLVGTFVSFPSEIIRTSVNMLQLTAADLKSDNPGLRAIGRKRAAGIAMVSGGFYALAALTAAAAGVGDDEEEALRDLAAPWSKNSTFLYTGRDADGKLRYFDLSFLDPYGYWKRPLTAMMRDQPWEKAAASGLSDMLSPFFGADITAGAIFEVLANKKPTGGPVFNPDAGSVDQLQDISNHMRKALQPGFVSNAERLYLAGTESRREGSGQPYDMRDEMVSLLGWRAATLDTQTGLYYRSFDFTDALSNARKTLTRTLRSSNPVTDGEIGESKQAANAQYQQAFTEMGRLVSAAQAAGMTRAEVVQTLKTSGIAQTNIMALVNGRVPPMQISLAAQAKAVKQARTMRDSEHAAEIARRFRLAREQ